MSRKIRNRNLSWSLLLSFVVGQFLFLYHFHEDHSLKKCTETERIPHVHNNHADFCTLCQPYVQSILFFNTSIISLYFRQDKHRFTFGKQENRYSRIDTITLRGPPNEGIII